METFLDFCNHGVDMGSMISNQHLMNFHVLRLEIHVMFFIGLTRALYV